VATGLNRLGLARASEGRHPPRTEAAQRAVALDEAKPLPKVIDFGVVKATDQRLTEKTPVAGFGAIISTLESISLEQAEINSSHAVALYRSNARADAPGRAWRTPARTCPGWGCRYRAG